MILACTVIAVPAADQGPTGNAARMQRHVEMSEKPWTQLLSQNGLDLKPGESYLLKFWAKASQPMTLRVIMKIDQAPWTGLGEQKRELGTEWELHEVLLEPTTPEPGHTRLEFRYGGPESGDIWIANAELRPEADAGAPNMIRNGNFEEQLTSWYTEGVRPNGFSVLVEPVKGATAP